jgi:hypothetical protein
MEKDMTKTSELLADMKAALSVPNAELSKAWAQSGSAVSGMTGYPIDGPAKDIYPVITPLRNRIPRLTAMGGIQASWRAITGINTTGIAAGVSEGNRGGVITSTTADYLAAYKGLGLEDYVTFEADYAAQGFEDVRALSTTGLLRSLMIAEEQVILGGNTSVALGTTPTPSLTGSASGGTLAAQTLSVICVALSFNGFRNGTVAGGIPAAVSRTNADGSSDSYGGGSAQKSASATVVITGSTSSVAATVSYVNGAVGYAWFWGTAGSEVLGAITSINSVSITANAAGSQTAASLPSSDNSTNSLVYDGLLSQIFKAGSNAYIKTMATGTAGTGTPLTGNADGTISEFEVALKAFWDNYRLSPTDIYVSSQEQQNITAKILTSSANSAQRFVFNTTQDGIQGGGVVRSYLNRFAMDGPVELPIRLHPNLPAGTVLFFCDQLPYSLSNVANVLQVRARRDYYQVEWPVTKRRFEYGVYCDTVLQNYFPPAFGVIRNISNG